MTQFAFVFPGQGSQSVGMLSDMAAAYPVIEETFREASAALGYDLWALAQQGPKLEPQKKLCEALRFAHEWATLLRECSKAPAYRMPNRIWMKSFFS